MRNVALIILDTVRRDVFDDYATRLQKMGTSVEQCRAASSWSVPSHASLLTGKLPHRHGIHSFNRDYSSLAVEDTFLSELPDHRTTGASANVYASSAFGFDTVFDEYSNIAPQRRFPRGIDVGRFAHDHAGEDGSRALDFLKAALSHTHTLQSLANGAVVKIQDLQQYLPAPKLFDDGARLVARESRRLFRESNEPVFLFANFMDAHPPFRHFREFDRSLHDAPNTWTSAEFDDATIRNDPEIRDKYISLYQASVDYLDRIVSDLVNDLRAMSDKPLTVIVTADHGQNLGGELDRKLVGHVKTSLTEGVLHVPFVVINPPESFNQPEGYLSHLSVPELITTFGYGNVPDVGSKRAVAEVIGIGDADPTLGEGVPKWDRTIRSAYEDECKYVWDSNGDQMIYKLDHDRPCWQRRRSDDVTVPDWAIELFDENPSTYRERVASDDRSNTNTATERRLRDLGYLS
jgi:arylsulfatase A-like enzyme